MHSHFQTQYHGTNMSKEDMNSKDNHTNYFIEDTCSLEANTDIPSFCTLEEIEAHLAYV